ncbi:MAG: hypothetical protein JWO72_2784 [Caulobacteraceae bacterium]|jgi:hypothetical protein|nr:hypothetical protein [Caulobacteraceae bacterium]
MITLLIGATLAVQPPSDALCASAYALEVQHMQESGELPSPAAQSLTPPQRTAVAAARRLIVQGVAWTALATRTPEGRQEANAAFRALSKSLTDANAAFAACSAIRVEDRMPAISEPPPPADGEEECLAEVGGFYDSMRACVSLEALRAQAQATQSKLERGALTCRSREQAQSVWAQIGSAAAGADSQGQKTRCAQ